MLLMGATGAYSAQADFNDSMLEPYAVLSTDNTTLTFYYDKKRNSRTGTTYDLNTGSYIPGWYSNYANITSVEFDSSFSDARPTTCFAWFNGCTILTSITGMEYLNTSQVTDMQNMFTNCHILASVDLSHFDTSNVENMAAMFSRCYNLAAIDVSHFDLSKVPNLLGMFNECTSLESLDVSNFIIPDPNSYFGYGSLYLFNGCSKLKTLVVPATANNLEANACSGVGTQDAPCILAYPVGFTPEQTDSGDGWYQWKGGFFKPYPKGDANHDNLVSIADVTLTVDYVLSLHPSNFFIESADVVPDGIISIADITTIVDIVLK